LMAQDLHRSVPPMHTHALSCRIGLRRIRGENGT
jgi:hypothetical protein